MRISPVYNPLIDVTPEFAKQINARELAKRLIESRIAIALVGLGLRPAARTVRAHVRAEISSSGLALWVANLAQSIKAEQEQTSKLTVDAGNVSLTLPQEPRFSGYKFGVDGMQVRML